MTVYRSRAARRRWDDAIDWAGGKRDRLVCKLFRLHGAGCRGRRDHIVLGEGIIDPGRWR
jgi:hypothetical protein